MYGPGGRRAGSASGRATALDRPRERAVIALRLGATIQLNFGTLWTPKAEKADFWNPPFFFC